MSTDIEERASFEIIRYASCWEDADILVDALDAGPGSNVLSVASGGDNTFALLARGPELVVAADISRAQLACVELKRAAFIELDHPGFLAFLGFRESDRDRVATYHSLRSILGADARSFWDRNEKTIHGGMIHAGKFEHYFHLFRRRIIPLIHGRRDVAMLLAEKSRGEREKFYDERWDTWRWRMIFRIFFSRFVMGKLGRDPEFFRYVEGSVAARILDRVRYALTALPVHDNPYVTYILTGNFGDALPFYARRENFETIRENLGALRLFAGGVDDAMREYDRHFHALNLSDIFEYMDESLFADIARRLLDGCAPGARLAYWNMLVPRRISERFPDTTFHLEHLSKELFARDRAFFYQAFIVDQKTG